MKVNKNQIGFQDEWLVILITLLVFNIKTLKNALKVLKEKKKTYNFRIILNNLIKYNHEACKLITECL